MTPSRRHVPGFTLIELIIAVSLSTVIVYMAFSAFRVAAQSISIANRMSLENQLMRAGFVYANEAVDFWTDLDNPDSAAPLAHPLRGTDDNGCAPLPGMPADCYQQGLPFTPFASTFPAPIAPAPLDPERKPEWDGSDMAWSASNPAAWWRGDTCQSWQFDLTHGFYSIFANADSDSATPSSVDSYWTTYDADPALGNGNPAWNGYDPTRSPYQDYWQTRAYASTASGLTVRSPHPWLYRQMRALFKSIGYFGFCDYLPANSMLGWYQRFSHQEQGTNPRSPMWLRLRPSQLQDTDQGGVPLKLIANGGQCDGNFNRGRDFFNETDWDARTIPGRFNLTHQGLVALPAPVMRMTYKAIYDTNGILGYRPLPGQQSQAPLVVSDLFRYSYFNWAWVSMWTGAGPGGFADQSTLQWFNDHTAMGDWPLQVRPSHWPNLTIGVQRYLRDSHFFNLCRVNITSPLTGEAKELNFTTFGTTLRGARQQRGKNAGWAKWDDAGTSFTYDPAISHLDAP